MAEKNLVEEALIQIQNLEEAINENAKEILHSTMKEEISELVKESMKNGAEEEDEFEVEDEMVSEEESEEEEDEFEFEDESEEDESEEEENEFGTEDDEDSDEMFDMSNLSNMSGDDEFGSMGIQDLSDESMDTVLKAFKEMKPTDTFEIKKDGDFIHLKDEEDEYLIQTESEEDEFEMGDFNEEEEEEEEIVYEIEMDDKSEEEIDEQTDEMYSEMYSEDEEEEEDEEYMTESSQLVGLSKGFKSETKESTKAKVGKGGSVGKPKFDYKKSKGGFNEKKSYVNPTKGTGKPKFEFKEGEMFEMPSRTPKLSKEEAKEASRTYGMGWREGALKKGAQAGQKQARLYTESMVEELEMLKVKNEEYRKALNMFRDKLNEVAVFNSNLAYATRLFTEHSTSKQEKINVLRRFDSAESLKESKALYRTIKEELGGESKKFMTESIEKVIDKSPQSGSAVNLIESKTYENPQFLRMKDIMSKIIK
jgi:hypothetical protein